MNKNKILLMKFNESLKDEYKDITNSSYHSLLTTIFKSRKKNTLNLSKNSMLSSYLLLVGTLFNETFFVNEIKKSIDIPMGFPWIFDTKGKRWPTVTPILTNKQKIKLLPTYVFGIYYPKKEEYVWVNLDEVKKIAGVLESKYRNELVNHTNITNISLKQATNIAIWLRTTFYSRKIKHDEFKSHNLVVFKLEISEGNYVIMYALIDLGYPDPKHTDDMSKKLSLFRIMPSKKLLGGYYQPFEHKLNRISNPRLSIKDKNSMIKIIKAHFYS